MASSISRVPVSGVCGDGKGKYGKPWESEGKVRGLAGEDHSLPWRKTTDIEVRREILGPKEAGPESCESYVIP
jgi:hypothetical protein